MSALGQKRTSQHIRTMSALPPIADIRNGSDHVRRSSSGQLRVIHRNPPRLIVEQRGCGSPADGRLPASLFLGTIAIGGTLARLGNVLYWAATAVAIVLVVLAVLAYFTATGTGALQSALRRLCRPGLADRPRDLVRARWSPTFRHGFRKSSGSSAMFAAMRRQS